MSCNTGRHKKPCLLILLTFLFIDLSFSQVRVRVLAGLTPEFILFSVTEGKYLVNMGLNDSIFVIKGEPVILSLFSGKIGLKAWNAKGLLCDSVLFRGMTGDDNFSLRTVVNGTPEQYYSGDLQCFPDLGTLMLINTCDIENYLEGVVKAEGGNGKDEEYFKTQAVIARTYTFRYFNKHLADRYNLCDNTHCQAFNGLIRDRTITKAVLDTKGLVIVDPDSNLIISAFHSNCGGETSPSEFVWVTDQPYLKKIIDPYCLKSKNATWQKRISLKEWVEYLRKNGYSGTYEDPTVLNFTQVSRLADYRTGSFTLPLRVIRTDLELRSTFFSLFTQGDSILIKGRGYGHGVGLCQEGAISMASKGFDFKKIINFYYPGVLITDIKNAGNMESEK
jgi:stage II sporulation protein D